MIKYKHKVCFTSVCTADSYSYYIPLFVYTVKRAYPDVGVKVFVTGTLKQDVKNALALIPYDGWEVKENTFSAYPDKTSMTNSLRFLVSKQSYKGYDYVLVKDIDFLIFSHKPTHAEYFIKKMKGLPYFGVRGPYRHPRRYAVNRIGWKGNFTRIAGGSFSFNVKAWYKKTEKALNEYRHNLKRGLVDKFDNNKPASYREYDEVMLYRIIKKSGLPTPRKKGKTYHGYHVPKMYRDIHLGDFGKKKHGFRRLTRRMSDENVRNFIHLEQEPVWQKISTLMTTKNAKIRSMLRRVRRHVKSC